MKISKDYVKIETVKITDDYPPGVFPYISYGIHRTLTDSLFSVRTHRHNANYSQCVLLNMIFHETTYWRVDFPMKGGLIDTDKCNPDSSYYHFVDFIQQIRKCIDERHSSARCRGSCRGPGWDRKGGVKLTDYDIRFLKNITTTSGRENRNSNYYVDSIYGISKDITLEYLNYITHMLQQNKGLVKPTTYMYSYSDETKVVHKYLWRCNDYLKKREIMELYHLYRVRTPGNLFNFKYFKNTSITVTYIENKYFSSFARTLKKHWFSSSFPKLDRLFIAKCRLSFTKNEGLCYDINEKIMKEFQKILYQI